MKKLLFIVIAIDIILCGLFVLTLFDKEAEPDKPDERQISETTIQRICELATLDCYYHNATEWSRDSDWKGYGAKKLWMEYDGVVRVGIEAGSIKVSEPDEENVITVTMPEATILNHDLDEDSIYEIDSSSYMWGFLPFHSSVSTEERRAALAYAQKEMVAGASQNWAILVEAQDRAKKIIEKNIVTLGEASGKQYKVRFVNAS